MNKEEMPLVSIIVACHNGSDYIDGCMESLIGQTYQNIEIVVCDDFSKDDSLLKLKAWEKRDHRITILQNYNNLFAAATRNKCLQVTHGTYVAIQDIDDLSDRKRIEVELMKLKDSNVDFVSCSVGIFSNTPQNIERVFKANNDIPSRRSFLWGIPFFHPSTIFTRESLIAVNGYRIAKETRRGQDYDLFMRLYAAGYKGKRISDVLYFYREDNKTISRRTFKSCIGEFTIRKKGFKALGMMPWAWPFTFKPFVSHLIQYIRYYGKR